MYRGCEKTVLVLPFTDMHQPIRARHLSLGALLPLFLLATGCADTTPLGPLDGGAGQDAQRPPGQYDECGNGMDDDGDGLIDEDCFCGIGETQRCFSGLYPNRAIGICSDGVQTCELEGSTEFGRWGACEGDTVPAVEVCGDSIDNDCDAAIDEGCGCTEGETWECGLDFGISPCQRGMQVCLPDGTRSQCEGAIGPSAEVCGDSIDNDCDGLSDEGCGCVPEPEICGDSVDNDCDGEVDELGCLGELAVAAMSAGRYHTCAGSSPGHLVCWGRNLAGVLGDGTEDNRPTPVEVAGLVNAVGVSAGDFSTCALSATGEVSCWGLGSNGHLGDGSGSNSPTPRPVPGLAGVVSLSAGTSHRCALRSGGDIHCWGENTHGQLGNGTTDDFQLTPGAALGIDDAIEIETGDFYTCARNAVGSVRCFGDNDYGQLGDGNVSERSPLVEMLDVTDAAQLSGGREFGCTLLMSGQVVCSGFNRDGQLGDGTFVDRHTRAPVSGLTDAIELVSGTGHSCARRASGQVVCWGANGSGQLGDGTTVNRNEPVAVPGLDTGVTELVIGSNHTCARRGVDEILCWGDNSFGQLGDGTTTERRAPTPVVGFGG